MKTNKLRVRQKLNGTWIALNGVSKVETFGVGEDAEAAALAWLTAQGVAASEATVQHSRGWKWSKNQVEAVTEAAV